MERLSAATAQQELHLTCLQCYIRRHVAPECVLPLREQKQVISHFEILPPAEKISVPASSYLPVKQ